MDQGLADLISNPSPFYIAVGVIVLSTLYYLFKNRGIPPGPIGLPYLGYWPFLRDDTCHLQLADLAKKYGDVFSYTFTGRLYIHLGSVKVAREAFLTRADCFSERVDSFSVLRYYLQNGVAFMKGEGWKTVRKFFLLQFRERGMNIIKENLSGPMYDTIRETISDLKETKGEPVDIASIVLSKCNKIMRQTLLGDDGMTEKEMREYNKNYLDSMMSMTNMNMMLVGKFAEYFIAPFITSIRRGKKGHILAKDMLTKVINRRKATFDENNIRDCIDAFLKEKKIRQSKNDPTAKYFTDEVLMISLIQMVGDGVTFMALFVSCFLKNLLDHPEEQEKIYREIVEVVGLDRNPVIEDRSKLTYTNAFVSEVMRTTDVLTLFPNVECTKETTINGYRIPKGAITVYNFWAAHMNPEDYEEPEKFNPSRFIPKDGEKKPDFLSLFGIGRRACMGEGFAMIQVFLFLTTIVKNFRLTKPAGLKEGNNLFYYFEKIEICAHPRS